jgi:hypothetical protein
LIILIGRFFFVVCLCLISIRHLVKYFYIFEWKYVVFLNDDFFSQFITIAVLVLSFVFEFASYFLGYHNEDLDFHICSGNNPLFNINETLKLLSRPSNTTLSQVWFMPDKITDPIDIFSTISLSLILLINVKTWCYIHRTNVKKVIHSILANFKINKISPIINENREIEVLQLRSNLVGKFENTKSIIFGEGSSLIINLLTFGSLIILAASKDFGMRDLSSLNNGTGRTISYVGKNVLPTIVYLLFPLLVILNNKKMKNSLSRDVRELLSTQF